MFRSCSGFGEVAVPKVLNLDVYVIANEVKQSVNQQIASVVPPSQ